MHGNVCILTESRSLTVFSGRTFRKCGHTFPIWTSGSADPAQKLLPHQHSRSPYTSWKYSAFRGLFDTSFSKNSLKPSSNTSRKSGVTPPTYSWISDNFSVTQQVTCSLKCDLLGHILASEAISAKGEKRKFWLLCWLLFSFFLIRFFIGQILLLRSLRFIPIKGGTEARLSPFSWAFISWYSCVATASINSRCFGVAW